MLCEHTDKSGLWFSCVFYYYTEQGDGSVWFFVGHFVETSASRGDFLCSFFLEPSRDFVKVWALANV